MTELCLEGSVYACGWYGHQHKQIYLLIMPLGCFLVCRRVLLGYVTANGVQVPAHVPISRRLLGFLGNHEPQADMRRLLGFLRALDVYLCNKSHHLSFFPLTYKDATAM